MLVYLYTLETPNFYDKEQVGRNGFDAAEDCYHLGDKYELPDFRDSACQHMLKCIQKRFRNWKIESRQVKSCWVYFIERLWSWEIEGSTRLRRTVVNQLVLIADDVIKNESFQELLHEHEEFNLAFIGALVTATKK